jgi:A/G-specific adenine glycosylase
MNIMRRSSRLAIESIGSPVKSGPSPASQPMAHAKRAANASNTKRTSSDSDAYESSASDRDEAERANKRRKTTTRPAVSKRSIGQPGGAQRLLSVDGAPSVPIEPCALPQRRHTLSYHRPLLLDRREGRDALLKWFDGTAATRGMPWRKPWIDPASVPDPATLREQLERRAYQVWISEIMLQQTRVAVVIDYWNRWMEKWPTIQDLAAASPDDVLAMWRGLGYYSRATRIHEAAKLVCGDPVMKGLLPSDVVELEKKVPGVGRYTAGAITAIVFGEASPMVDGNVLRVLSRQMGVLGDVKTEKATIDLLWSSADALVKAVANDAEVDEERDGPRDRPRTSNRPGRWGQALMELGSTTCTPKPNCAACPITASCRAYGEGLQSVIKKEQNISAVLPDIEDECTYCKPFEEYADTDDDETTTKVTKKPKAGTNSKDGKKQSSLSSFFTSQNGSSKTKSKGATAPSTEPDAATLEKISNHARKFPVKTIKKAVREEETLVCAIRRKSDGQYLIQKRPEKGLLAGLWEFPSHLLAEAKETTTKSRKETATNFVHELLGDKVEKGLKHVGELGSIPWLFSHIKLTMHVHLFELSDAKSLAPKIGERSRWSDDVESESMGTGMRKCWTMIQDNDV